MRPRWPARIHMTWPLLTMVSGLLLLLTYLLFQSRIPTPIRDTYFHEALQEIALHEVRLTRDVLLVRAGLLPHVDALVQTSRALRTDAGDAAARQHHARGRPGHRLA